MQNPLVLAPPPRRILALCTRRLGDVLLTTPLLRTLRRAWPAATLDVLTLESSAPALAGNPDITRVVTIPAGAGVRESLRALGPARAYDLALSTLYSDRPHYMALWAAPRRVNLVPAGAAHGARWKRALSTRFAPTSRAHTVMQYLQLADCLGLARQYDLVPPRAPRPHAALAALRAPFAVLHPLPLYRYKRWHVAGWAALVRWLERQGVAVVLSGGPAETERAYAAEVVAAAGVAVTNLAGQLSFPELTDLLEAAAVFVGPDTSVTHLAAACGAPTVTPFGPTGVTVWGPWPRGFTGAGGTPWVRAAPLQHHGNVWIVQGLPHCVPCEREGCERHLDSRADCLDQMPASRIISAAEAALRAGRVRFDSSSARY